MYRCDGTQGGNKRLQEFFGEGIEEEDPCERDAEEMEEAAPAAKKAAINDRLTVYRNFIDSDFTGKAFHVVKEWIYKGDFIKGKAHGIGMKILNNGAVLKGEFENDCFKKGIVISPISEIIVGELKEGAFAGNGFMIKSTGAVYKGRLDPSSEGMEFFPGELPAKVKGHRCPSLEEFLGQSPPPMQTFIRSKIRAPEDEPVRIVEDVSCFMGQGSEGVKVIREAFWKGVSNPDGSFKGIHIDKDGTMMIGNIHKTLNDPRAIVLRHDGTLCIGKFINHRFTEGIKVKPDGQYKQFKV